MKPYEILLKSLKNFKHKSEKIFKNKHFNIFEEIDLERIKYAGKQWPCNVFIPNEKVVNIVLNNLSQEKRNFFYYLVNNKLLDNKFKEFVDLMSTIHTLAAWRTGMDIVQFDTDFLDALSNSEIDEIPSCIFQRLPAYSLYVDTPNLNLGEKIIDGFLVTSEYNIQKSTSSLEFVFYEKNPEFTLVDTFAGTVEHDTFTGVLRINGEKLGNIENTIMNPHSESINLLTKTGFQKIVNIMAYICSYGITPKTDNNYNIRYKNIQKKFKKIRKIIPPEKPRITTIGEEFGNKIRKWLEEKHNGQSNLSNESTVVDGRGGTVKPHLRRGHWHTFLCGKGRTEIKVLWVHPVFCAFPKNEEDNAMDS